MKTIIILAALSLAGAALAQEHLRCSRDMLGDTQCQDQAGRTSRSHTDTFGNTTTSDMQGRTTRSHTDQFGNITVMRPDGSTVYGHTDQFGTSFVGPGGRTTHCRKSAYGLPGETQIDCQ